MITADFDFVRQIVRAQSAIVLEPGKEYLVQSRLHSLARKEKQPSVEALIARLRANPAGELQAKVVEAMTTNETSFFRDLHPFEALRKYLLPELIGRRGAERQLNFWCGAASTGQEPFTVLMTINGHFPELLGWNLHYLATDISPETIARARAGRFSQLEVNRGLPASLLVKYFTRQGAEWEFRADLRRRVDFREMYLIQNWVRMPPLDIVFLRNMLIYFDVPTKKAILARVRQVLRPGGYLLLGGAETTFNLNEGFERVVMEKTACYRLKPA